MAVLATAVRSSQRSASISARGARYTPQPQTHYPPSKKREYFHLIFRPSDRILTQGRVGLGASRTPPLQRDQRERTSVLGSQARGREAPPSGSRRLACTLAHYAPRPPPKRR